MDVLDALHTGVRRARTRFIPRSSDSESSDNEETDDLMRATRLLRFVKLVLVIVVTALTIARMLGWL